jgi:hypothetical protein
VLDRGLVDIKMSLEGDLMLGDDGDIALTEGFDGLAREVNKRLRTNNPEWRYHPTIGADLEFYIGLRNTEAVAKRIRQSIERSLSINDIGFPGTWNIEIFPIGDTTLSIIINLNMIGIDIMLTKLIYDYNNGSVQPLEDTDWKRIPIPADVVPLDISKRAGPAYPNKYQRAINTTEQ